MMHNGKWNERQWQRIEEEYQEPAREVIRVFYEEMHVPICQIAEMLYICESTLKRWCQIWGIKIKRGGYIKKEVPGKVQLRARLMGYDDVGQAIAVMRADGMRWDDIQIRLKCSDSTISRYMPEAAKGRYNLSENGLEAKRANARRLNEQMKSGEIERGGFAKVPLQMVTPWP